MLKPENFDVETIEPSGITASWPRLEFKAHKMYITAIFTYLVAQKQKSTMFI